MHGRDYCGKRYSSAEELLVHLKTHTNLSVSSEMAGPGLGAGPAYAGLISQSLMRGKEGASREEGGRGSAEDGLSLAGAGRALDERHACRERRSQADARMGWRRSTT